MQTALADFIRDTPQGRTADGILRKCVHCGFCTATCPTYQLLGDELDGPRGRIYLIKQVLEGDEPSARVRLHLDRCLTCRSCETTCPSGVEYGRLLDVGRGVVEDRAPRGPAERLVRRALRAVIPYRRRFGPLLRLGQWLRPLLPKALRAKVPSRRPAGPWPPARHARRMLVLAGCAQPAMAPDINAAAARYLDRLGISLLEAPAAGCCGAVSHHLTAAAEALAFARRNIDAWWPHLEAGVEAVVMTASGCGAMVRDYAHLLAADPLYAERAARVAALTRDLAEIVAAEPVPAGGAPTNPGLRVSFHAPCTLQHAQRIRGVVEGVLQRAGYALTPVAEAHMCCGSAGTYSLLQPTLARRLRERKVDALQAGDPDVIVTANIGCLVHLDGGARVPVRHWIELLAPATH